MARVLVIGSSDIDIFATPKDMRKTSIENKRVSFELGAKVPISLKNMTLGGNGANVSVGMKKLRFESTFYTYLGSDILSRQIEEDLEAHGVDVIEDVKRGERTSLSFIMDLESDRVIFSHHEMRDYGFDTAKLPDASAIYLTSIGENWSGAYRKILDYASEKNITLAFSPGSPQLAQINELVLETVQKSTLLFMNKEEGQKILQAKGIGAAEIQDILKGLQDLNTHVVSITDGKNGSYAVSDEGIFHLPPFDIDSKSTDKTGAGDAYASGFYSAFLMGKSLVECMRWGALNAYGVMQEIGAQNGLLTHEKMQELLDSHVDFQPKAL